MKRILLCVAAGCVLAGAAFGVRFVVWPNSTVVTNKSGSIVTDVTMTLSSINDDWNASRYVEALAPGESMKIRHAQNDTLVNLKFVIDGAAIVHEERYVDLWWGERWNLFINADGSVDSGY